MLLNQDQLADLSALVASCTSCLFQVYQSQSQCNSWSLCCKVSQSHSQYFINMGWKSQHAWQWRAHIEINSRIHLAWNPVGNAHVFSQRDLILISANRPKALSCQTLTSTIYLFYLAFSSLLLVACKSKTNRWASFQLKGVCTF